MGGTLQAAATAHVTCVEHWEYVPGCHAVLLHHAARAAYAKSP